MNSFCNIATIASNSPVYSQDISPLSIHLCDSSQKWRNSFIELIEYPDKLDKVVLSAQQEIKQNYSDDLLACQVYNIIQRAIKAANP